MKQGKNKQRKSKPSRAKAILLDEKTGEAVRFTEPHVIVPIRRLQPGREISQAWHAAHFPGCWEQHSQCALDRLRALFSAATNLVNLFQSIPLPLGSVHPATRHVYAVSMAELLGELAKTAHPEIKGFYVPDAEDDGRAVERKKKEE